VVGNVWEDPPNTSFDAMVRTWQVGFTRLYTFDVRGSANRILVGLARPEKQSRAALESRAEKLERAKSVPFDLSALVAEGYEDATERKPRGAVLKDAALAPVQVP
jgi:spermidine synthase